MDFNDTKFATITNISRHNDTTYYTFDKLRHYKGIDYEYQYYDIVFKHEDKYYYVTGDVAFNYNDIGNSLAIPIEFEHLLIDVTKEYTRFVKIKNMTEVEE
jgi:hypothetical protein